MTQADIASTQQGYYVQANSLNVYYEMYGVGESLILLHGGTLTSRMWEDHIPILAQHFHVIAPEWNHPPRKALPVASRFLK